MDGTIYLGDSVIPGAMDFLRKVEDTGREYYFYTNNSSHDADECLAKLRKIGLDVPADKIIISSHVAIDYIKTFRPGSRIFLLGNENFTRDCLKAGLNLVNDKPDIVLLGFDTTLNYDKINKAANFIAEGCEYAATHPDKNCPLPDGFMTDTGSMLEMFRVSAGRYPDIIFGKPYRHTVDYVTRKLGFSKDELCFVGDRLETDIAIGCDNGVDSILVYTGVTTPDMYVRSGYKASLAVENLSEVIPYLK